MVDQAKASIPSAKGGREQSPWALAGLGTQFVVALLAFGFAGNWIDARLGVSPLFLLAGVFFGGGGTFYASYRRFMKAIEADDASKASASVGPR